jgi:hypothetical protein
LATEKLFILLPKYIHRVPTIVEEEGVEEEVGAEGDEEEGLTQSCRLIFTRNDFQRIYIKTNVSPTIQFEMCAARNMSSFQGYLTCWLLSEYAPCFNGFVKARYIF